MKMKSAGWSNRVTTYLEELKRGRDVLLSEVTSTDINENRLDVGNLADHVQGGSEGHKSVSGCRNNEDMSVIKSM